MSNGVIYSAYGSKAIHEALKSIHSLKLSNPDVQTAVITDDPKPFTHDADSIIEFESEDRFGRWAKLNADILTPFNNTLYLDADTRVHGSLSPIFEWLDAGFEFVSTLSARQKVQWLWHIEPETRSETNYEIGFIPAQIQGGVWGFRRTANVRSFMALWRNIWKADGIKHDQAALAKAFRQKPMKTLFIGHDFNGGMIVHHLYGRAER